jgi:putative transposase
MLQDGARYHVTARVNRREMILERHSMRELFLKTIRRAKEKYDFSIENFCIMGNHIHFIIQPGEGECLSSIMQWLLSVFAMRYNRIHHLWGHVWGERFYSDIIPSFRDFLRTFDYVDDNPLAACLLIDRRKWQFGGLWHHRYGDKSVVDDIPEWYGGFVPDHCQLLLC